MSGDSLMIFMSVFSSWQMGHPPKMWCIRVEFIFMCIFSMFLWIVVSN